MAALLSSALLRTQADRRLAALSAGGSERAFEALVERYRRPLQAYCRRMLLPAEAAEDVVQQAFLSTWQALERGTQITDMKPWLYRVTHNAAVNALRSSGYDHEELSDALHGSEAPDEDLERRITIRRTLAGVAGLPDLQREALLRTAVEGHTHEQVARELGLTDGAVRGLVYRARTTLRAAATALTPMPLLEWATSAGTRHAPMAERIGEMLAGGGSAGGAALLLKGGAATVLSASALAGGAAVVEHQRGRASAAPPVTTQQTGATRQETTTTSERLVTLAADRSVADRQRSGDQAKRRARPGHPDDRRAGEAFALPGDEDARPGRTETATTTQPAGDRRRPAEPDNRADDDDDRSGRGPGDQADEDDRDDADDDHSGSGSGRPADDPAQDDERDDDPETPGGSGSTSGSDYEPDEPEKPDDAEDRVDREEQDAPDDRSAPGSGSGPSRTGSGAETERDAVPEDDAALLEP